MDIFKGVKIYVQYFCYFYHRFRHYFYYLFYNHYFHYFSNYLHNKIWFYYYFYFYLLSLILVIILLWYINNVSIFINVLKKVNIFNLKVNNIDSLIFIVFFLKLLSGNRLKYFFLLLYLSSLTLLERRIIISIIDSSYNSNKSRG